MEFHLDRKIVLEPKSEYKSLYDWSLQEMDDEGNKVGRPQIPWPWSLDFTATQIKLTDVFSAEREFRLSKEENDDKLITTHKRKIHAELKSGLPHMGWRGRGASYSMFGTDRRLTNIELSIEPIDDEAHINRCYVWGCPSYTTDIDFRDVTTDDGMHFSLYVSQEAFDRYAASIASQAVDEAFLYVRYVDGFYSEWSPAISTNAVKVLSSDKNHKVEAPSDCGIVPPRLGKVGEVHLHWNKRAAPAYYADETDDELDDWADGAADDEDEMEQAALHPARSVSQFDDRVVQQLSSLRNVAWVIAALLLLILIT